MRRAPTAGSRRGPPRPKSGAPRTAGSRSSRRTVRTPRSARRHRDIPLLGGPDHHAHRHLPFFVNRFTHALLRAVPSWHTAWLRRRGARRAGLGPSVLSQGALDMPDEVLQRTPLVLLVERGPAVLPAYELRIPKGLGGGLVDDVEPEPGGALLDGPQGVHVLVGAVGLNDDARRRVRPNVSTAPRTRGLSTTMSSSVRTLCRHSGPPSQASYTRLVHSPYSGTLGSWRCGGSSWVPCGRPKSITGGSKGTR